MDAHKIFEVLERYSVTIGAFCLKYNKFEANYETNSKQMLIRGIIWVAICSYNFLSNYENIYFQRNNFVAIIVNLQSIAWSTVLIIETLNQFVNCEKYQKSYNQFLNLERSLTFNRRKSYFKLKRFLSWFVSYLVLHELIAFAYFIIIEFPKNRFISLYDQFSIFFRVYHLFLSTFQHVAFLCALKNHLEEFLHNMNNDVRSMIDHFDRFLNLVQWYAEASSVEIIVKLFMQFQIYSFALYHFSRFFLKNDEENHFDKTDYLYVVLIIWQNSLIMLVSFWCNGFNTIDELVSLLQLS